MNLLEIVLVVALIFAVLGGGYGYRSVRRRRTGHPPRVFLTGRL